MIAIQERRCRVVARRKPARLLVAGAEVLLTSRFVSSSRDPASAGIHVSSREFSWNPMRTTLLRDSQERNLKSREVRAWRACERIYSASRALARCCARSVQATTARDIARYRERSDIRVSPPANRQEEVGFAREFIRASRRDSRNLIDPLTSRKERAEFSSAAPRRGIAPRFKVSFVEPLEPRLRSTVVSARRLI